MILFLDIDEIPDENKKSIQKAISQENISKKNNKKEYFFLF